MGKTHFLIISPQKSSSQRSRKRKGDCFFSFFKIKTLHAGFTDFQHHVSCFVFLSGVSTSVPMFSSGLCPCFVKAMKYSPILRFQLPLIKPISDTMQL